jgi:spore coat protein U domain-containing protein, fimbrial subunit CupE1/2/3/6
MRPLLLATLVFGSALLCATSLQAGTANGTLTVQATVVDACSVASASLSFGSVSPSAGTAIPATTSINVTCTLGTPFTVGLSTGQNASGGNRRMLGASNVYLGYRLYQDLLLTTPFGDTGSSDRASGLGLGITATPIAVFGAVTSGQNVGSGSYSDSVQITVYY